MVGGHRASKLVGSLRGETVKAFLKINKGLRRTVITLEATESFIQVNHCSRVSHETATWSFLNNYHLAPGALPLKSGHAIERFHLLSEINTTLQAAAMQCTVTVPATKANWSKTSRISNHTLTLTHTHTDTANSQHTALYQMGSFN